MPSGSRTRWACVYAFTLSHHRCGALRVYGCTYVPFFRVYPRTYTCPSLPELLLPTSRECVNSSAVRGATVSVSVSAFAVCKGCVVTDMLFTDAIFRGAVIAANSCVDARLPSSVLLLYTEI